MQKTYMAIIKIPFTLANDGSMTPHQDRYAIDFQSIDELPPINREEHGALLQQLLSSNIDIQCSENIERASTEYESSNTIESADYNHIMVSIHELMNRQSVKQSKNISFKRRPHSARKMHTAKKRFHPANDSLA